jgi:transposase-like protein
MDNWIIAITCTFPHEAHMIEGYLNSNGIETNLQDEMTVQVNIAYSNAVGGVKILVKETEYARSIQLLKNNGYITDHNAQGRTEKEVYLVEYSKNHKNCPFCNSENIGIKKKPNGVSFIFSLLISLLFFAVIAPIYKSVYKCFDCEKEWKYKKKPSN